MLTGTSFYTVVLIFITQASCHQSSSSHSRHRPPPLRLHHVPYPRSPSIISSLGASTYSSPSSLWPLPLNVSTPPNSTPCIFGEPLPNSFIAGCADGGYPCQQFATLEAAQAACAIDYNCGGVTSQDGGVAPWETRHGTSAGSSGGGELSYLIINDCHSSNGGFCFALPSTFSIISSNDSFSNDILTAALTRYTSIINSQVAPTTVLPYNRTQLANLIVTVTTTDDILRFGVDESYTLNITGEAATLTASTVFGALRGLETVSQLAHHSWTTTSNGNINSSYNELCGTNIFDAPRFSYRGLMLDTSRHFLSVAVIKQVMDLMSYLKMNALRLHLIDETSWSYYVPQLPNITNTSAFSPLHVYYPDDLIQLVAYGRLRGIILYPEVDFPSHSQGLLESIPLMGCLTPAPNPYRVFIDPTYPDLWETMDKIFSPLNAIFPHHYPFHMGGDEVDRNTWATCPSVISFLKARGGTPGNANNEITDWWYTNMYNFLASPPYNRTVFAWEDMTDAVNASWVGATDGGLVIEQWNGNPGTWNSDTCSILSSSNASVLISGPFHDVIGGPPSFNSDPNQNYADMYNLTCPITARVVQQIIGPELMFWCDAADSSSSDLILMLMSSVVPVAESGWSSESVVSTGMVNGGGRYQDMRCRLARRGMQSHDAYGHVGTFCLTEYEPQQMPWDRE